MAGSESKAKFSRKRSSAPEFFISYTGHDVATAYAALSERFGITPPFQSSKDLSDLHLQRVLRAVRYDSAKLEGVAKTKSPKRRR